MRSSYLDYAMSVIIGRALPDVRDGLKPVHRRILYGMYELGLTSDKPYRKCAKIVGEVLGKYHPHGDQAVYDTLVRMAQDFNMRYLLADGQGNFGSVDGDSPAQMRYTEARLTRLAEELVADIEKETVDFTPNFDESTEEPLFLPTKVPNLLINGSEGIAVGMATKIPPHNLGEIVEAAILLINKPKSTLDDILAIVPGPDFPTGAYIYGRSGIKAAYATGRGQFTMRAKAAIERPTKDKQQIVITAIPYQVNKANTIKRIAELVQNKKIDGISDVRDESDREGMRIVIELRRGEQPEVILNNLYKHTQLQETFGMIMLAIVNGQPRTLPLIDALQLFIDHRVNVVRRRTEYDLRKAQERAHILEGFLKALSQLDAVITLIRKAQSPAVAKTGLMQQFQLSEIQAQAILDMRLQRLTGLEREKILEEHAETTRQIARYKEILADEREVYKIITAELQEVKRLHGDERRTQIVDETTEISIEDMIVEEDMVVTISHEGYIKRNAVALYRAQRRGGRGKIGAATKEEDFVEDLFVASTHSYILFFTTSGRVYWLKVHELPQAGRAARGKAVVNLLNIEKDEKLSAFLPVREFQEGRYVVFATAKGTVKKTDLMAYANPRRSGIIAISLDEGDEVIGVRLTDGHQELILSTRMGQAIRFREEEVRPMGRGAGGVRGISLEEGDSVVGMTAVSPGATLLAVAEKGYGKRTEMDEYRLQSRGGKGIITMKTTEKTGAVVGVRMVSDEDDIMLITDGGKVIRTPVKGISVIGRNTQGVRLIDLAEGERVVGVARLAEKEDEDDGNKEEDEGNVILLTDPIDEDNGGERGGNG
jgi:DNA gyrase subunit A